MKRGDVMQKRMSAAGCMFVLLVGLFLTGTTPVVAADEAIVDVSSPDAMKSVLEQQIGKRVKVKLCSGQDVEGKVAKVGSHAVQLTELVGMELFDATVKLDDVAAVIVRARSK
ncbi:MAG: hypothetical protein OEV01_06415 [Nitrospira sp.]|nr:hypothetical protein [Nitrospira sp.]MDH4303329.1 hypothetical protein [Nitrospira sp.]